MKVLQGCVLSPCLFDICMDGVLCEMREIVVHCQKGETDWKVPWMFCADYAGLLNQRSRIEWCAALMIYVGRGC